MTTREDFSRRLLERADATWEAVAHLFDEALEAAGLGEETPEERAEREQLEALERDSEAKRRAEIRGG